MNKDVFIKKKKGDGGSVGIARYRSVRWTSCRLSSRELGRPGWCPAEWQRAVHGVGQRGGGGAAAGSGAAEDPGAVGPTSNTPSYAGTAVVGRRSAGPRRGSRRGLRRRAPGYRRVEGS